MPRGQQDPAPEQVARVLESFPSINIHAGAHASVEVHAPVALAQHGGRASASVIGRGRRTPLRPRARWVGRRGRSRGSGGSDRLDHMGVIQEWAPHMCRKASPGGAGGGPSTPRSALARGAGGHKDAVGRELV